MKLQHIILLLFICVFSLNTGNANAEPTDQKESILLDQDGTGVVRIFSQVVSHGLPAGWKIAHRSEAKDHFMLEFIPEDQELGNWSSMFTVQGFRGLVAKENAGPKNIIAMVTQVNMQFCGKGIAFVLIDAPAVSNNPTQGAIIGCSRAPSDIPAIGLKKGMGEIGYFIAVEGKKDMYLFSKAQKGEGFNVNDAPLTKDNFEDFISEFMPIELTSP